MFIPIHITIDSFASNLERKKKEKIYILRKTESALCSILYNISFFLFPFVLCHFHQRCRPPPGSTLMDCRFNPRHVGIFFFFSLSSVALCLSVIQPRQLTNSSSSSTVAVLLDLYFSFLRYKEQKKNSVKKIILKWFRALNIIAAALLWSRLQSLLLLFFGSFMFCFEIFNFSFSFLKKATRWK